MEQETNIAGQGTRLSESAPWESYGAEMEAKMSEEMAVLVAEYAERAYEADATSNQNKEELHRQQEDNDELAKQYQWLKEEEYEDIEQRIGRVMHSSVFISKLREIGVSCWYTEHPQPRKITLLVAPNSQTPPELGCWAQQGFMPELSIMRFDDHGVPLDERRRGWRTCLLQLILKGFVTEQAANEVFGNPKQTDAFDRYNSTLQAFRNAGSSLGE